MSVLGDPSARLVIAHRGASAFFPENTTAAFDHAVSLGVDALELDVRLSADDIPVVIHDPTVDRTTDGQGAVEGLTRAELQALDAGAGFRAGGAAPFAGKGVRIPTFDEILGRYPDVPLVIEMKVASAAAEARRVIERHGASKRVLIDSTIPAAVASFRPTIPTGASFDGVLGLLPRAVLGLSPEELPYAALCIPRWYNGIPIPVVRLSRAARQRGVATHVWTVDDTAVARRLWSAGIAGIITNDPEKMLRARASYKL